MRERERGREGGREGERGDCCFVFVQGDAAFWWNLKKSGDGDLRTRHAGCPVLVGSKWGKCTHSLTVDYLFLATVNYVEWQR